MNRLEKAVGIFWDVASNDYKWVIDRDTIIADFLSRDFNIEKLDEKELISRILIIAEDHWGKAVKEMMKLPQKLTIKDFLGDFLIKPRIHSLGDAHYERTGKQTFKLAYIKTSSGKMIYARS